MDNSTNVDQNSPLKLNRTILAKTLKNTTTIFKHSETQT